MYQGFYRPSDEELNRALKEGLIVLDASFLLNLYRLPDQARKDIIEVLRLVRGHIWVPYQAGLEFQRNRLKVIAEQKTTFVKVRNALLETVKSFKKVIEPMALKKRHSMIDPAYFITEQNSLINSLVDELDVLAEKQLNVDQNDPLRACLDEILDGYLGEPPATQKELDCFFNEGKIRYERKIPPGYMDDFKETYSYGGLYYDGKYGDLVLWKQLIEHTKSEGIDMVILLSEDSKEDWYLLVDGKKVMPRPELTEEILREGGVRIFYIYNSENFLKYAKYCFEIAIRDESITAARDVAAEADKTSSFQAEIMEYLEGALYDLGNNMTNSDDHVTSAIATTNAWGFCPDDIHVIEIDQINNNSATFKAEIHFSGEQDPDRPWSGNQIDLVVSGVLEKSRGEWVIQDYSVDSCETDL